MCDYGEEELTVQVSISHVSNEKYKNKEGIWMDKLACIRQVLSLFLHDAGESRISALRNGENSNRIL